MWILHAIFVSGNAYETLKDASKRRTYDLQTPFDSDRTSTSRPQHTSTSKTAGGNTSGGSTPGNGGYTYFRHDSANNKNQTNNGFKSSFSFSG